MWNLRDNWKSLLSLLAAFLIVYNLPIGVERFEHSLLEGFSLVRWYAREHVVFCLLPAFFIAGAISVFLSKESVMKYLGKSAKKWVAYSVAALSGTILAVCSCTVLPLFASIHKRGAGLGPATAFLYSGPAINILAIVLTARILGLEMGIARAVGAIVFSVVIGLLMELIFPEDETEKIDFASNVEKDKALWQYIIFFSSLVGILVFANWARPESSSGLWSAIYHSKWYITSGFALILGVSLVLFHGIRTWAVVLLSVILGVSAMFLPTMITFSIGVLGLSVLVLTSGRENGEWFSETYGFTTQILPLLFFGVLIAGFLLGRPDTEGMIPSHWIHSAVGGNSIRANFFASFAGAFMYFATLTEIPILQGLMGNGMGKGPALALLLAGPALSLPNMLVIRSVMGTKKTLVFISLVIIMATISGLIFGTFF